ncbi:hypothetical protein GCM10009615_03400 [Corynebacterium durum]
MELPVRRLKKESKRKSIDPRKFLLEPKLNARELPPELSSELPTELPPELSSELPPELSSELPSKPELPRPLLSAGATELPSNAAPPRIAAPESRPVVSN